MLEIVCQGAPNSDRGNEDSFVAYQRNGSQPEHTLAAIDGATSVAFYEPLVGYLRQERNGITPAALAAAVTRDAILEYLGTAQSLTGLNPRQLLLHANKVLRDLLNQKASGIYDADAIIAINPDHLALLDDPRKIRLFLPAAVATVAAIDTASMSLHYAHIGDTALILGYPDGRVDVPTREKKAAASYETALFAAIKEVAGSGLSMLEVIHHPLIQSLNRDNRINHNYVDKHGNTLLSRGTGVVNGLPQLADYIQTGVVSLKGVEAVILASDGFLWPDNPFDSHSDFMQGITRLWSTIQSNNVAHYLRILRAEERADAGREKYPRFKLHDDATGLVLRLNERV